MFNPNEACKAQAKYQKDNKVPAFSPANGRCFSCKKNIYQEIKKMGSDGIEFSTGISVESAGNHLITSCPHCHRSFCD